MQENLERGDYEFQRSLKSAAGQNVTWFSNEGWGCCSQRLLFIVPQKRL